MTFVLGELFLLCFTVQKLPAYIDMETFVTYFEHMNHSLLSCFFDKCVCICLC